MNKSQWKLCTIISFFKCSELVTCLVFSISIQYFSILLKVTVLAAYQKVLVNNWLWMWLITRETWSMQYKHPDPVQHSAWVNSTTRWILQVYGWTYFPEFVQLHKQNILCYIHLFSHDAMFTSNNFHIHHDVIGKSVYMIGCDAISLHGGLSIYTIAGTTYHKQ